MTGDDLKHMQDGFLDGAQKILRMHGQLRPVGFIVTMHNHIDKLYESGFGLEFIDFKSCMRDDRDDKYAVLILDMAMDWKRLYHATLTLMPKARAALEPLLKLAQTIEVDDPYLRVMRPFLAHMEMEEKDIVAATMQHICGKVDAFASIMQSEAWLRYVDPGETVDEIYKNAPKSLGQDQKSVEVIVSTMETYAFTRMVTVPILRKPSKHKDPQKRDKAKITGFGDPDERIDASEDKSDLVGRFVRFLKPLGIAS